MKPHKTLRNILVHPKDKITKENVAECIYKIGCKNCDASYIGETGRRFGVRLGEHRKDTESQEEKKFTRSERKQSESQINKSAITDHAMQENHVIDWENSKVLERENHLLKRQIKEAIWIRRSGAVLNRDEGAHRLSHIYDQVIK
ncbi:uncharacterized protein LOC132561750 [Ylistrum balloti]|uniref:uncharacterized protein LOC132561750 n=1 Tax=Ylistrum balloti TaxID=509963 RepID=UPI002905C703|nr:uncharacterized protein LOC132561750 [Ylistrum balloti]